MNAGERTGHLPGISRTALNGGGPRNTCKRNGRDSNPRALWASRFQGGCICPLCHRSGVEASQGVRALGGLSGRRLHCGPSRRGAGVAERGALLRR